MSTLEDLIQQPLHEISDEDLENAIITGRLGREIAKKEVKQKKEKQLKLSMEVDADEFE